MLTPMIVVWIYLEISGYFFTKLDIMFLLLT